MQRDLGDRIAARASATRKSLGAGGLALLALACCAGLPLVAAAGLSAAALAWLGGMAAGAVALAVLAAILITRAGRRARGRTTCDTAVPTSTKETAMEHDCCTPATTTAGPSHLVSEGTPPLVEILYFDGCPNLDPAVALVERTAANVGLEPRIQLVNVPDAEAATRLRFLGSPTVRIGGRDVEPAADRRTDFALSCRVYRTDHGVVGQPDESWVREALLREAPASA